MLAALFYAASPDLPVPLPVNRWHETTTDTVTVDLHSPEQFPVPPL